MDISPAVDNYILDKPESVRLTLQILRDIIFETVKDATEQIKWGCPFYIKDGLLCYLNFEKKTKQVVLGFVEGNAMNDKYHLFSHDTAQIKKIYFQNAKSIPVAKVKLYLREATKINCRKEKNYINVKKKG